MRARFLGRAFSDDGLATDEARAVLLAKRSLERGVHRFDIMAVNVWHDVPAVGFEALRRVVGEPVLDMAVDRDAVVVVERHELAEPERSGERAHFVRDALHQASVTDEYVCVVIDDLESRPVELGGEQPLGERHADRVTETLPERAGRRLDARREAVLGMTWRHRAELTETLDLG